MGILRLEEEMKLSKNDVFWKHYSISDSNRFAGIHTKQSIKNNHKKSKLCNITQKEAACL